MYYFRDNIKSYTKINNFYSPKNNDIFTKKTLNLIVEIHYLPVLVNFLFIFGEIRLSFGEK